MSNRPLSNTTHCRYPNVTQKKANMAPNTNRRKILEPDIIKNFAIERCNKCKHINDNCVCPQSAHIPEKNIINRFKLPNNYVNKCKICKCVNCICSDTTTDTESESVSSYTNKTCYKPIFPVYTKSSPCCPQPICPPVGRFARSAPISFINQIVQPVGPTYVTLGYFPWVDSSYFKYGKIVFEALISGLPLDIRIVNETSGVILAELGVNQSGFKELEFTFPLTPSRISVQIRNQAGVGTPSRIYGINLLIGA